MYRIMQNLCGCEAGCGEMDGELFIILICLFACVAVVRLNYSSIESIIESYAQMCETICLKRKEICLKRKETGT